MTLEDFFTLSEMKDGLTAPSRVEELVKLMQSEKDSGVNNDGDATQQWVAVASTIAATENKDCLDLFVQLDGLWLVDKWLKDAQKLGNDTTESFVDESITALLRALEKLRIDNKRSISTGIWTTVETLLGHKSSEVQDRARQLFDSWKQDGDAVDRDAQDGGLVCDDGSSNLSVEESKPSTVDNIPSEVGANSENHASSAAQDETLPLSKSDVLQPESADVQIPTFNKQSLTQQVSDNADVKDKSPDPLGSTVIEASQQSPIKVESSLGSVACTSVGTPSAPIAKLSNADGTDNLKFYEIENHTGNNSSPKKLGGSEISSMSALLESGVCSDADAATSQVLVNDTALQKEVDAKVDASCQNTTAPSCESTPSDPQVVADVTRPVNHCNTVIPRSDCLNIPQELSGSGSMSGKLEDVETSSKMDDLGAVEDEDEERQSDEEEDLTIPIALSKPARVESPNKFEKRRADIEAEYGMVDALEVARQVAQEVEREVVDYREPNSSSSSGKMSEDELRQPGSPDSIDEKQGPPTEVASEEVPVEQSHSVKENPEKKSRVAVSEDQGMIPEHSVHNLENSQVTEMAQEPEVNQAKGLCGFDLNEEVCSDEMDHSANPVSTPIPLSRPAAASDLPVSPLQFGGAIGLKGTPGNSAFRRASPRRFSDSEKNLSTGATTDISKQRPDYLFLDLNVALGGDDLGKQIPSSSGLPSGESSGEVSQRSVRPKLDLNQIDDDSDAQTLNLRVEGQFLFNRNGRRSPSPASSSSSMQPLMRNFDLNDRPYFQNDSIDQGSARSSQNATAYRGQLDASVISILGTKVEIKRNDVPNGKGIIETAGDTNLARAGSLLELGTRVSYTNSPVFGYNGLATGPALSFSSTMYGPGGTIPYMVDSRGAPVVPQLMASASAVPAPFSQPPFIMNMNGMQPSINGAGPSRPSFDLNSGFMVEGGNRDSGFRPLFIHGQGGLMEDHMNNVMPPSSSNVGGKRKEPEGGWEPYPPFSYKHHQQPPWR